MKNKQPEIWLRWKVIAGIGIGNRHAEIAVNQFGKYRLLYWMFPRGHALFDVEQNEVALLARVEKELGKLARAMVEEALRVHREPPGPRSASTRDGVAAPVPEGVESSGACPI